ncbi:hypothetical protein [Limnohabitans sp. Rim8]|uniref:hypothetical protein n=1 Tax=Limnohabitans sp. Rim8 TaxID=1100718 RepID=UPI0025CE8D63|nr:hypothetical protein [Limnohabitans sp. Rim8]
MTIPHVLQTKYMVALQVEIEGNFCEVQPTFPDAREGWSMEKVGEDPHIYKLDGSSKK